MVSSALRSGPSLGMASSLPTQNSGDRVLPHDAMFQTEL